mmetsp:Transcript_11220/g.38219  ORF Transcript_11220/g.38219 Transcript_11220/m.38219 type:complete len:135 (-) Transcript_11220:23-427(-)
MLELGGNDGDAELEPDRDMLAGLAALGLPEDDFGDAYEDDLEEFEEFEVREKKPLGFDGNDEDEGRPSAPGPASNATPAAPAEVPKLAKKDIGRDSWNPTTIDAYIVLNVETTGGSKQANSTARARVQRRCSAP